MTGKNPTLIIIDGSSVIYRAFHAIPETLTSPSGMITNAVYGFTQTLRKIIKDWRPEYIGVAFDVKGPSFRHGLFEEYKATRPAMPDALQPQIPYIKQMTAAHGIPVMEKEGFEADDVIATVVKKLGKSGIRILLVTGDKDMHQLVDGDCLVLDHSTGKLSGVKEVEEKFGIPPRLIKDFLGLAGDSSDNIPGVPGIGPKTAVKLIGEFGSIDEIYANIDMVAPEKLREKLLAHKGQALMSRDLATLHADVDVDVDLDALKSAQPDASVLLPLLRELGFKKLFNEASEGAQTEGGAGVTVHDPAELDGLIERMRQASRFAITIAPVEDDSRAGVYVCHDGQTASFIPDALTDRLKGVVEDAAVTKDTGDSKAVFVYFKKRGIQVKGIGIDASLASYLLDPSRSGHTVEALSYEYLGHAELKGEPGQYQNVRDIPALSHALNKKLEDEGLMNIYRELEGPLAEVLAEMELAGIAVDTGILNQLSKEMEIELGAMEKRIYEAAGTEFNINSPKQLAEVLFERLGLKPTKKTKTGFSTDEEVLRQLSTKHAVPGLILGFRQVSKLKSTYVDALLGLVDPADGRVHTSFNQTVTATGRLSSSRPNLQNIPARTAAAERLREAFVAPPGCVLLSADYSQIELRIVAHLSEDPALIDAFNKDEDIHSRTASEVFGVMPGLVTQELRRRAKAINFGIIYGMGAYGLSTELGCSVKEAEEYINGYFGRYKAVKAFIDRTIKEAAELGYTTTVYGRRRFIPELKSPIDATVRFGRRMAVNTPIQGAAADMIKAAMIKIRGRLKETGMKARMLLQIHDELIFEAPVEEAWTLAALLRKEMEGGVSLRVPVKVNIKQGGNWREAG